MTFQLDTSGSVFVPISPGHSRGYRWSDFPAFDQGYMRAMPWEELAARVWSCAECSFQGFEGDANPDRDWCGNCCCDAPSSAEVCPGCGHDSLCSACPKCCASYFADPSAEFGFRHLAPATVERIIVDCARIADLIGSVLTAEDGRRIWEHRQEGFPGPGHLDGELGAAFPPLVPFLSDDGLIMLREVGQ